MTSEPSAAFVRRWLVIRLIRWAEWGWAASYSAYVRCDKGELPWRWHRFWTWIANRIDHAARGLAHKLDKNNQWTGAEMAKHGWWG